MSLTVLDEQRLRVIAVVRYDLRMIPFTCKEIDSVAVGTVCIVSHRKEIILGTAFVWGFS